MTQAIRFLGGANQQKPFTWFRLAGIALRFVVESGECITFLRPLLLSVHRVQICVIVYFVLVRQERGRPICLTRIWKTSGVTWAFVEGTSPLEVIGAESARLPLSETVRSSEPSRLSESVRLISSRSRPRVAERRTAYLI